MRYNCFVIIVIISLGVKREKYYISV